MTIDEFPNLQPASFQTTSPADISYNCLAWAAHYTDRWLDPLKPTGYWPADIPRRNTLNNLTKVYEALGYSRCASPHLEVGYEKIAIYTDRRGLPQHAARQLQSGRWTSKLGQEEDIEHDHLQVFEGSSYGTPARYLRRALQQPAVAPREATESPAP